MCDIILQQINKFCLCCSFRSTLVNFLDSSTFLMVRLWAPNSVQLMLCVLQILRLPLKCITCISLIQSNSTRSLGLLGLLLRRHPADFPSSSRNSGFQLRDQREIFIRHFRRVSRNDKLTRLVRNLIRHATDPRAEASLTILRRRDGRQPHGAYEHSRLQCNMGGAQVRRQFPDCLGRGLSRLQFSEMHLPRANLIKTPRLPALQSCSRFFGGGVIAPAGGDLDDNFRS